MEAKILGYQINFLRKASRCLSRADGFLPGEFLHEQKQPIVLLLAMYEPGNAFHT